MNEPILEAHNIRKVFTEGRNTIEVLRGVSLSLTRGEVVALEGRSGSGKTTLLSILGCVLTPTSGDLRVDDARMGDSAGKSQPDLARVRRQSIGFVFQQYNLFPSLSALQNIEYALHVRGWKHRAARTEAQRVLEAVGLQDRGAFLPSDLSGGQKQRVAIARALAGDMPILLADEPTANLDSATGTQVLDLFRHLARVENRAVLIVTHDPRVRTIADRVLEMVDGLLVHEEANHALLHPLTAVGAA